MDIKIGLRTLDVLKNLFSKKKESFDFVRFKPQKVSFSDDIPYEQSFTRTSPEDEGIDSGYLLNFIDELENMPDTNVHSMMILRNAHVIAEGAFSPYQEEVWHISHSLCKSIVSMGVGIAIEEGLFSLDDKISDILKDYKKYFMTFAKRPITVRNLLMMSSGMLVNEVCAVTGNEWIRTCLESTQKFEPGKKFHYNSMNTYLLTAAICKTSGMGLLEYLKPRLLDPLGIKRIHWEQSPEGIEKGGWGLYICIEDMAKLGQLCLQNGKWNGVQLVPEKYLKEATSYHIDSTTGKGLFGYGYQFWMGERPGSYIFNGMLGQIVYCIPDLNMVFTFTGGSENIYRDNKVNFLIEKYFGKAYVLPEKIQNVRGDIKELKNRMQSLTYNNQFMAEGLTRTKRSEALKAITGRSFKVPEETIGLYPLFIQCVHNNYSAGINRIALREKEGRLIVSVREGKNTNKLLIDFDEPLYCDIHENGEDYLTAVEGKLIVNEDDVLVLKIVISFIETSNVRIIKIYFEDDKTRAVFTETPGIEMMLNSLSSVAGTVQQSPVMNSAVVKLDEDYIMHRMQVAFAPEVELTEITKQLKEDEHGKK